MSLLIFSVCVGKDIDNSSSLPEPIWTGIWSKFLRSVESSTGCYPVDLPLNLVQELFYKIIFGSDPLCMRSSCQCSSGALEVVSLLVGYRCTTLVGSIGKTLETITFQVFLWRFVNGNLWIVATIYHNLFITWNEVERYFRKSWKFYILFPFPYSVIFSVIFALGILMN